MMLQQEKQEDNDDPEMLQQAAIHAKRLELRQKQIDEDKNQRFRKHPEKSLSRNWIEGLRSEIEAGRFDS